MKCSAWESAALNPTAPIGQADHLSDKTVLHKAAHDPRYFELLVKRYRNRLRVYVRGYLRQADTVEDLVQETFIRCWVNREKFAQIEKVSGWLYTIAGNLAKSELRHRHRWQLESIDHTDVHENITSILSEKTPLPDEILETRLHLEKIHTALNDLPTPFRQAVFLRDVQGLSYEEIAQSTGNPLGTVKSRVKRGRTKLQTRLGDLFQGLAAN